MRKVVLQRFDGEKWKSVGVLAVATDGELEADDFTMSAAQGEFFNPNAGRVVDNSEPELLLETLVKFAGNSYQRWMEAA